MIDKMKIKIATINAENEFYQRNKKKTLRN